MGMYTSIDVDLYPMYDVEESVHVHWCWPVPHVDGSVYIHWFWPVPHVDGSVHVQWCWPVSRVDGSVHVHWCWPVLQVGEYIQYRDIVVFTVVDLCIYNDADQCSRTLCTFTPVLEHLFGCWSASSFWTDAVLDVGRFGWRYMPSPGIIASVKMALLLQCCYCCYSASWTWAKQKQRRPLCNTFSPMCVRIVLHWSFRCGRMWYYVDSWTAPSFESDSAVGWQQSASSDCRQSISLSVSVCHYVSWRFVHNQPVCPFITMLQLVRKAWPTCLAAKFLASQKNKHSLVCLFFWLAKI